MTQDSGGTTVDPGGAPGAAKDGRDSGFGSPGEKEDGSEGGSEDGGRDGAETPNRQGGGAIDLDTAHDRAS